MKNLNHKVLLLLIVTLLLSTTAYSVEVKEPKSAITEVYDLIKTYHISGHIPKEKAKLSVNEMLKELKDPYAIYYSKQQVTSLFKSVQGQIAGIGILIGARSDKVFIDHVFANTPASYGGLLDGDQILSINQKSVKKKSLEQIINLIKGEKGTSLTLQILRKNNVHHLNIKRDIVEIPMIESSMFPGNIGYIRMTSFTNKAASEFTLKLEELEKQGMNSLIFDLRGNSGGVISSANKVVGQFVAEGTLAFTKDKNKEKKTIPITGSRENKLPIVILVNEQTASAAEVTSGALRHYAKAVIVGTNTYGKGTVQQLFMLEEGGALKLTVDEYSLPAQDKVDGIGLLPDIYVKEPLNQLKTAQNIIRKGEFN